MARRHNVYYYDINKESRKFAEFLNGKFADKINFVNTEDEAFEKDLDCVVCVDVLEHLEEPMKLVKKITNKLKSGQAFFTTGLNFSTGPHIPMHLKKNRDYMKEYTDYMERNYVLYFFHRTKNETIYLWIKK